MEELNTRLLEEKIPSETRLVQLYMSKQANMAKVFPESWVEQAKAFYLVWLRRAATALNLKADTPNVAHSTAREKNKVLKKVNTCLFDGLEIGVDEDGDVEGAGSDDSGPAAAESRDQVMDEVKRWSILPAARIQPFKHVPTGSLNEFKLLHSLKEEFPLHFFVFRQTAIHIGAEANAETTFSLSGSLSNPNTKTNPHFLSLMTRAKKNRACLDPPASKVLEKYLAKYRVPDFGEDVHIVDIDEDSDALADESSDESDAA